MPGTPSILDALRQRLPAHLQALEHGLLERTTAARLLLLAALAGEHVLLIGPPGTATPGEPGRPGIASPGGGLDPRVSRVLH